MTHRTIHNVLPSLSLLAALGLQAACASDSRNSAGTGGSPGVGGTAVGGSGGMAVVGASSDPCSSGRCAPSRFPFVNTAIASSDTCGSNCPLLVVDTPVGKTTATLSQPEEGTLCLSGMVSPDGWAALGLVFAVWAVGDQARTDMNEPRTEILKKFNADALGITQVSFTIDSPPGGGVSVSAAITTATSCPDGASGCVTTGFDLMSGPGSSVPVNYTARAPVIAPFANFKQTVGMQRFDTRALQHLVFGVGSGSYNFCIHDFKFLDAQGNEVMEPQPQDGGVSAAGTGGGDSTTNSDGGAIIAASDSGGETSSGKYVAMGSSYAAGPKIPDAVPDQSCGRSTPNYAHLVAAAFGLDLTEVSCIGARIDNVTTTPQAMNPQSSRT